MAPPLLPAAGAIPCGGKDGIRRIIKRDRAKTTADAARTGERLACFDSSAGLAPCPVYDRDLLEPGHRFDGPAIVDQLDSTTVVYPGQRALVDDYLNIIIDIA